MKYSEFFKLLEKKDHLINKLTSLTPKQKQEAIAFFTKHPKYENEIDWNRKDLTWEDLEEIIYTERISGAQLKNFVKKDKHFLVLYSDKNCVLYQPLTWLGSRYLASTDVKPKIEGSWCISYQKDRSYWDDYSFEKGDSFIILCTSTTKYAIEISPRGTFVPWNAEDYKFKESDFFYNEVSKEISNIENVLQKYIPIAINNHSLVEQFHKKDLEECAHIEKVKEEEREYRIRIFPKSFKRQVKKKGYYNWDWDISYDDLKDLGLVDSEDRVDERFKYFRVSGNLDFKESPITSITIPDSVTHIGDYAFYSCWSLTEITIPEGVTDIGKGVFCECESLKEISIPKSVRHIGGHSLSHCVSLESVIIPEGVTSIGDYAFYGCSSLKDIVIPDSVTSSIGNAAFWDCSSLKSVTIGKSVTSIGESAFQYCSSLISITIPNSITSIEDGAFYECRSLKTVYIDKEKDSLDISKAKIPPQTEIYWRGEFNSHTIF